MKKSLLIITVCCLSLSAINAQDLGKKSVPHSDSLALAEKNQKDSLLEVYHFIIGRKNKLQRDSSRIAVSFSKKQKELEAQKKRLEDAKYNQEVSPLSLLLKESKQLAAEIRALNYDIDSLSSVASTMDALIHDDSIHVAELNGFRQEVCQQVIQDNTDYLELPFTQMVFSRLLEIKKKCGQFSEDKAVKKFLARTDTVIRYKGIIDDAVKTVHSKYNKRNVIQCQESLKNVRTVNLQQSAERDSLKRQLEAFEPGVRVFKDFIYELNRRRGGNDYYNNSDLNDDLPKIMNQTKFDGNKRVEEINLQIRINKTVNIVPYLKEKYDRYNALIKKLPTSHPDIENEIMAL